MCLFAIEAWYAERKAMLQAGIRTLLNASRPKKRAPKKTKNVQPYSTQLAQPPPPKGYLHKIPTRKPALTRKGFLLPQKVILFYRKMVQKKNLITH